MSSLEKYLFSSVLESGELFKTATRSKRRRVRFCLERIRSSRKIISVFLETQSRMLASSPNLKPKHSSSGCVLVENFLCGTSAGRTSSEGHAVGFSSGFVMEATNNFWWCTVHEVVPRTSTKSFRTVYAAFNKTKIYWRSSPSKILK